MLMVHNDIIQSLWAGRTQAKFARIFPIIHVFTKFFHFTTTHLLEWDPWNAPWTISWVTKEFRNSDGGTWSPLWTTFSEALRSVSTCDIAVDTRIKNHNVIVSLTSDVEACAKSAIIRDLGKMGNVWPWKQLWNNYTSPVFKKRKVILMSKSPLIGV